MRRTAMALLIGGVAAAASAQRTADLDFTYSYPAQARAIPVLRSWFDREAATLRAGSAGQAAADRRDAAKEGRPFHPYTTDRTWKVVADTPRFLSLSLETYDFTGGAHGNTTYNALVWDKAAGVRRTTLSFFSSRAALTAAIRPAFCRQLTQQRQEKRGGDAKAGLAEFDACIDPAGQTVILGSSTGTRFDRIGILIAPYEAGPYAEGTYEVTLPVTPAVLAAVRPAWRGYFAVMAAARSRGTP